MGLAKVLVTGAAGFIGSFLIEGLLEKGNYVVGIDNLFRGKAENIAHLNGNPQFHFHICDITKDFDKLNEIFQDVEIVYHFAAINGTEHFYQRPLEVLKVNVEGTKKILEFASKHTIKKFVFASSSEVYGDPQYFPTDEQHPIILKDVDNPRYSYSASKAIGEYYTKWYAESCGFHYLILRIFNIYGPRMDTSEYGQVIPEFIRKILLEKEFAIIGPGTQTRSFCYIDDCTEMIVKAGETVNDEILNVGNNQEIEILQVGKFLHELIGRDFNFKLLHPRQGDPKRRVPDISKAKKMLGYTPKVDLMNGLKLTLEWYKKKWGC